MRFALGALLFGFKLSLAQAGQINATKYAEHCRRLMTSPLIKSAVKLTEKNFGHKHVAYALSHLDELPPEEVRATFSILIQDLTRRLSSPVENDAALHNQTWSDAQRILKALVQRQDTVNVKILVDELARNLDSDELSEAQFKTVLEGLSASPNQSLQNIVRRILNHFGDHLNVLRAAYEEGRLTDGMIQEIMGSEKLNQVLLLARFLTPREKSDSLKALVTRVWALASLHDRFFEVPSVWKNVWYRSSVFAHYLYANIPDQMTLPLLLMLEPSPESAQLFIEIAQKSPLLRPELTGAFLDRWNFVIRRTAEELAHANSNSPNVGGKWSPNYIQSTYFYARAQRELAKFHLRQRGPGWRERAERLVQSLGADEVPFPELFDVAGTESPFKDVGFKEFGPQMVFSFDAFLPLNFKINAFLDLAESTTGIDRQRFVTRAVESEQQSSPRWLENLQSLNTLSTVSRLIRFALDVGEDAPAFRLYENWYRHFERLRQESYGQKNYPDIGNAILSRHFDLVVQAQLLRRSRGETAEVIWKRLDKLLEEPGLTDQFQFFEVDFFKQAISSLQPDERFQDLTEEMSRLAQVALGFDDQGAFADVIDTIFEAGAHAEIIFKLLDPSTEFSPGNQDLKVPHLKKWLPLLLKLSSANSTHRYKISARNRLKEIYRKHVDTQLDLNRESTVHDINDLVNDLVDLNESRPIPLRPNVGIPATN